MEGLHRKIRVGDSHGERQCRSLVHGLVRDDVHGRRLVGFEHEDGDRLSGALAGCSAVVDDDAHRVAGRALRFARGPGEGSGGTDRGPLRRARVQAERQRLSRHVGIGRADVEDEKRALVDALIGDGGQRGRAVDLPHSDLELACVVQAGGSVVDHEDADEIASRALELGGGPAEEAGDRIDGCALRSSGTQSEREGLGRQVGIRGADCETEERAFIDSPVADGLHDGWQVDLGHDDTEGLGGGEAGRSVVGDDDAHRVGGRALRFGRGPAERSRGSDRGPLGCADVQAEGKSLGWQVGIGGADVEDEQRALVNVLVDNGQQLRGVIVLTERQRPPQVEAEQQPAKKLTGGQEQWGNTPGSQPPQVHRYISLHLVGCLWEKAASVGMPREIFNTGEVPFSAPLRHRCGPVWASPPFASLCAATGSNLGQVLLDPLQELPADLRVAWLQPAPKGREFGHDSSRQSKRRKSELANPP